MISCSFLQRTIDKKRVYLEWITWKTFIKAISCKIAKTAYIMLRSLFEYHTSKEYDYCIKQTSMQIKPFYLIFIQFERMYIVLNLKGKTHITFFM